MADHSIDGDLHTFLTPDADALVRYLVTQGTPFADLEVRRASLEEAFLTLTAPATIGAL